MLELFGVLFITLFIAFLLTLVVLNLDMMFKKVRVEKLETVPKHKTRVKLRNKRKGKK